MQRRRKRFLKSRIALKNFGLLLQLSHELKMCWIVFSHSACTRRCARKAAKRCCLNNELWWPLSMLGESPDEKLKFRRTMAAMIASQSPKANFNQSQLTRNFSSTAAAHSLINHANSSLRVKNALRKSLINYPGSIQFFISPLDWSRWCLERCARRRDNREKWHQQL